MINLVQAKSIAEEEEYGYLDSKYELIYHSNDGGEPNGAMPTLDPDQIQELQELFAKVSGKKVPDVVLEQDMMSVEVFIDQINDLMIPRPVIKEEEEGV